MSSFLSRRWLRDWVALPLCCLGSGLPGCQEKLDYHLAEKFCIAVGPCDPPPVPATEVMILCDRTQFGVCTPASLTATLQRLLSRATDAPGSRVSLWMLTNSIGSTASIAEVSSPALKSKREGEQRAERERWVIAAQQQLLQAAEPYWKTPPPKKSLIAGALTKMGMVDSSLRPEIVLISDGLEVEGHSLDLEGGAVPGVERFLKIIHAHGWLIANSLPKVNIRFTFMQAGPEQPCGADIAQLLKVRHLWEVALRETGATVTFSTGVVQFDKAGLAAANTTGGTR